MLTLVVAAAVFVGRWLLRRHADEGLAQVPMAGALNAARVMPAAAGPARPTPAAAAASAGGLDADRFERVAKLLFLRMQAANDAADTTDLRRLTTPELYASLKLDLQARGPAVQETDVVQLEAAVVDRAEENGRSTASVRFSGLIRENRHAPATRFDEVWHFVRPAAGSREWAIAGVTATA